MSLQPRKRVSVPCKQIEDLIMLSNSRKIYCVVGVKTGWFAIVCIQHKYTNPILRLESIYCHTKNNSETIPRAHNSNLYAINPSLGFASSSILKSPIPIFNFQRFDAKFSKLNLFFWKKIDFFFLQGLSWIGKNLNLWNKVLNANCMIVCKFKTLKVCLKD